MGILAPNGGRSDRRTLSPPPKQNKYGVTRLRFWCASSAIKIIITLNVLHAIASAPHSEPSTRILATISIWTEVQPITLPRLVDGSLCQALAMGWSTLFCAGVVAMQ